MRDEIEYNLPKHRITDGSVKASARNLFLSECVFRARESIIALHGPKGDMLPSKEWMPKRYKHYEDKRRFIKASESVADTAAEVLSAAGGILLPIAGVLFIPGAYALFLIKVLRAFGAANRMS